MTAYVSHTTIDCRNACELSQWWKEVLECVEDPGDPNAPGRWLSLSRPPRCGAVERPA